MTGSKLKRASVKFKRVFISGPMDGIPYRNAPAFAKAHAMIAEAGAREVYDPMVVWLSCLGMPQSELVRKSLHAFLSVQFDLLVRLPGWSASDVSSLECDAAEALGIDVVDLCDLIEEE